MKIKLTGSKPNTYYAKLSNKYRNIKKEKFLETSYMEKYVMDIKIRYILRRKSDSALSEYILNISEIERSNLDKMKYYIISRDLFSGVKDINGQDIFVNDTVRLTADSPCADNPELAIDAQDVVVFGDGFFCTKYMVNNLFDYTVEKIGNVYNMSNTEDSI